jgi:hypothetical protein
MSPVIRGITIGVLLLPLVFGLWAIFSQDLLPIILCLLIIAIYAVVWFWCRPSRFLLRPDSLEILFPLWRRKISLADISGVEAIDQQTFSDRFGTAIRIGVGGLWGGFGWLWTSKQGIIEFYISQLDHFVLIQRLTGKSLLITPENPAEFCEVVNAYLGADSPQG